MELFSLYEFMYTLLGAILIYIDVFLDSAHKNNVIIGKRKY